VDDVDDRETKSKSSRERDRKRRTDNDGRTTDERQASRWCEKLCVTESRQSVSNGEVTESVGLSMKVVSV